MSKLITKYNNGNYTVRLYEDGTKIRHNNLDNFTPDFAESLDISVTTVCNGACNYCYLNCSEHGKHADLNNPVFNTVHKGTEMAINANDLSHPDLENFLIRMKEKGVFVSITINQIHLKDNISKLKDWQDRRLIWGIGISLKDSRDNILVEANNILKNVVIHIIDGCTTKEDLDNLSNNKFRLLILGYKHVGRGIDYYNANKDKIEGNIKFLREHIFEYKPNFYGIGFDGLANENLHIRETVGEQNWSIYHMGSEGEFTMYFDAVNNTYSVSSMESDKIYQVTDNDTLDTMFNHVRKIAGF